MSSTPASARSARAKQSKTVILRLSRDKLSAFTPAQSPTKAAGSKASTTPSTPTAAAKDSPPAEASTDPKYDTPNGNADGVQASGNGRKGSATTKPPIKRNASALNDSVTKARPRPGPKRRKVDGGFGAEEAGKPWTQSAPTGGHKLGPKANQGAINAGLRALDRSGKPCRRWAKSSFSVKSFTGVVWSLPSWTAPKRDQDSKEGSGDAATPNSNGDANAASSTGNAEADSAQANGNELNGIGSSPAPVAAA